MARASHPRLAALLVLGALAVAAAGCGGDATTDSVSSSAEGPVVEKRSESTTAPAAPSEDRGSTEKKVANGRKQDRSEPKPKQAKGGGGKKVSAKPAKASPNREPNTGGKVPGCPGDLDRERCAQAVQAIEASDGGASGGASSQCPAGMTKAHCEALAKAIEDEATAPSAAPDDESCPPALDEEQCRQAGEALR